MNRLLQRVAASIVDQHGGNAVTYVLDRANARQYRLSEHNFWISVLQVILECRLEQVLAAGDRRHDFERASVSVP